MKKYKSVITYTVVKTTTVDFESPYDTTSNEFNLALAATERTAIINANPGVDFDNDIEIFESEFSESN